MDMVFLPDHLVIVDGSYIGLEFAQMFARFGSRVTVIEKAPWLIPHKDEDVSDSVREILENEAIDNHPGVEEIAFSSRDGDIVVECQSAQAQKPGPGPNKSSSFWPDFQNL